MSKYKLLLFTLAMLSLACGATTESIGHVTEFPTQLPTSVPTHLLMGVTPVLLRGVVTGDPLRVREFATTDSKCVDILRKGTVVEIGAKIRNDNPNCAEWYPYQGAWICADFVEIK